MRRLTVLLVLALVFAAPMTAGYVLDRTSLGSDFNPCRSGGHLGFDIVHNKLYIPGYTADKISVLDCATGVLTDLPGTFDSPYNFVTNVGNGFVYATCGGGTANGERIVIIDSLGAVSSVPAGGDYGTFNLALDPTTGHVVFTTTTTDAARILAPELGNVIIPITLAGWDVLYVTANPVNGNVYVPGYGKDSVLVINGLTQLDRLAVQDGPTHVAVNGATNLVYVTCAGATQTLVQIIDGATNDTIRSVSVGDNTWVPNAIVADPLDNKAFVALGTAATLGKLYAVYGAGPAVASIDLPGSPVGMALDPVRHKLHLVGLSVAANWWYAVVDAPTLTVDTSFNVSEPFAGVTTAAIVYDPGSDRAYVAVDFTNAGTDDILYTVARVSSSTSQVAPMNGPQRGDFNLFTNKYYITGTLEDSLAILDMATSAVSKVKVADNPARTVVNPVTNMVYVSCRDSNSVYVVDGATAAVVAVVQVCKDPREMAVDPVRNVVYVASSDSSYVTAIDGVTYTPTQILVGTTPREAAYWDIEVNLKLNTIYVVDQMNEILTRIDGANYTNQFEVPTGTVPSWMCIDRFTDSVYVACDDAAGEVRVYRSNLGGSGTLTSPDINGAYWPEINPWTHQLYVTSRTDNKVVVFNTVDRTQLGVITGANDPLAVAIDPVRNAAWVPCRASDKVLFIDGASLGFVFLDAADAMYHTSVNPVTGDVVASASTGDGLVVFSRGSDGTAGLNTALTLWTGEFVAPCTLVTQGTADCGWTPNATSIAKVRNTTGAAWRDAAILTGGGTPSVTWQWNWNGGADSLLLGMNYLRVQALEQNASGTNNSGIGTPYAGGVSVYPVYRYPDGLATAETPQVRPPLCRMWPNPTADRLNISLSRADVGATVRVYDVAGKLVQARAVAPEAGVVGLDLSSLVAGVYLVNVNAGGRAVSQKVVVGR